jgi:hypothetical protein
MKFINKIKYSVDSPKKDLKKTNKIIELHNCSLVKITTGARFYPPMVERKLRQKWKNYFLK